MQGTKFSTATAAKKGGVATGILLLSLILEAKALPYVPKDILDAFPEHTLALTIVGPLAGLWNAAKYWLKKRKLTSPKEA